MTTKDDVPTNVRRGNKIAAGKLTKILGEELSWGATKEDFDYWQSVFKKLQRIEKEGF